MSDGRFWVISGIAGVLAVVCYLLAIALPWPDTQIGVSISLLVVSAWPILSIVYSYGMYSFIATENQGTANRLALVFAIAAFATVLAMIIVQLTIGAGFADVTKGLDEETAVAMKRALRLVDLGLDIAWDMLVGTALIFLGIAVRRRSGLGLGWTIPLVVVGTALIGLNAATFPWPPADAGLFDIGPVVGLIVLGLAVRLAMLGRRASG